MNWEQIKINIGEQRVGKKKVITFKPLGELKEIASMVSSCGCSTPKQVGNNIEVSYTPGSIPYHLVQQGFYTTTKKITITYKDNSKDVLSFTATVKK